jgi:hypothetical protein
LNISKIDRPLPARHGPGGEHNSGNLLRPKYPLPPAVPPCPVRCPFIPVEEEATGPLRVGLSAASSAASSASIPAAATHLSAINGILK